MKLCDVNPFLRYAELQPSALSGAPFSYAQDYRLFYILEGTANFVLTDRTVPLSAGMLLYFRPGIPYYFDGNAKIIVLNFDMTRDFADRTDPHHEEMPDVKIDPPEELGDLVIVKNAFSVESRMQKCLLHHEHPIAVSQAETSATVKQILCYVAQSTTDAPMQAHDTAQRIDLYIRRNYDKDISNSQISAAFGYHSFYLNRIFKKATGVTIHQAVIAERMRIAKELLSETGLTVKAVAAAVGYADHARFCTAFRSCVGQTPLQYRKSERN
jgi:AraC-like DNA-binding protein